MAGLRVVAGELGGRRLVAPAGARPTTERVREAVFSVLGGRVEGADVLDLYAGSGALAIEALSRGAERAVSVDRDPGAIGAVRRNAAALGIEDRLRVLRRPVARFVRGRPPAEAPFDLILCDPPYGLYPPAPGGLPATELRDALEALGSPAWASPQATLVLEGPAAGGSPLLPEPWMSTWERSYGDTLVTIASAP